MPGRICGECTTGLPASYGYQTDLTRTAAPQSTRRFHWKRTLTPLGHRLRLQLRSYRMGRAFMQGST
eukprot:8920735-Prorocentrum_lima.AAC.1